MTGYEVLRRQGSAALATLAADTGNTDTAYTDSGVTGDLDDYRYQVKALRGGDASQGSNVAGVLQSAHAGAIVPLADVTLISNVDQTAATGPAQVSATQSMAQGFTTGANTGGYTLGSVELAVSSFSGTASDITVSIYSESSDDPGTVVHTLTTPASISAAVTTFTAPSGTTLAAGTTYYVVISTTSSGISLSRTEATAEDTGGASGWSIADSRHFFGRSGWNTTTNPLRMRVNGAAGAAASTDATLSSLVLNDGTNDLTLTPTFASGTTSYMASVDNAVSQITVTPTKSDSDASVEYLDGNDAAISDADGAATGHQVALEVGENTIKVKVTAEDDATTETYTVVVTRQAQTQPEIWSATVTPGALSSLVGWWDRDPDIGAITDKDFTYDSVTYSVIHIRVSSAGNLQLNVDQAFTATAMANLVLDVDGSQFALSDSTGATDALRTWASSGVSWTVGTDVALKMLAETGANSPATGAPTISGTPAVGELLKADISNIGDADGIADADFEYQWIAFDGTTDSDISGATGETYRPLLAHLDQTIKVRVSFDDDDDNAESLTSAPTAAVTASTYGQVIWAATLTVEEETVAAGTFFGYSIGGRGSLEPNSFTHDGNSPIVTSLQYIGDQLRFYLSGDPLGSEDFNLYLDGAPFLIESPGTVTSIQLSDHGLTWTDEQEVEVRLTVNRAATGAPAITGKPEVGETLTADVSSIMDEDGVPAAAQFAYQWISDDGTDDSDIDGATDSTYTLVEADAGKSIKVRVSFTDNAKFPEFLTSAATTAVTVPVAALVSNVGQTAAGNANVTATQSQGQGFTTGSDSGGYTLGSVELAVSSFSGTASDITVSIYSESSDDPGTVVHTLTTPASISAAVTTFTAPSGTTLAAGTTYYVVISTTSSGINLSRTNATAEDTGGASGWSIADDRRFIGGGTWVTTSSPIRMRVNGAAASTDIWSATLTVAEFTIEPNTYRGYTHVGTAVGELDPSTFSHDGNEITVNNLWHIVGGLLTFEISQELGGEGFLLRLGEALLPLGEPTGDPPVYQFSDHGVSWSVGDTVEVRLIPNQAATGAPVITGTPEVSQTLTADISGIMDEDGLPAADQFAYQWISDGGDIDGATESTYWPSAGDVGNTIKVRVSFTDNGNYPESLTSAATRAVLEMGVTEVPADWSLIPSGLGPGDQFRLIFLSSETRTAEATNIATYNAWVQGLAANGHADIQDHSSTFRVVGSTAAVDARDNTSTTYTSSDKGVAIYWLGGDKAADDYEDFYDETWDEEASMRDESGTAVTAPSSVFTGSNHDGTTTDWHFGSTLDNVIVGIPNSTTANDGPLSSSLANVITLDKHLYALSGVFQVSLITEVPADWSLAPSGLGVGDQFRLLFISSMHRSASPSDIATYNTWVQDLAASGHTDIQDYSSSFRAVGSTEDMDARDNTYTTYTSSDKGVAIYWLGGNKVADDYADFYDEDWDEEASMKNESGTAESGVTAWTGSDHDGTEMLQGTPETSRALGNSGGNWVRFGKTNSDSHGPLSGATANRTGNKRIYGLSSVFEVVAGNNPATGAPTITGTAQVGELLMADASNIGDPDGIAGATFSYQWIADDGTTDSDIDGATGETYWPSAGDVGSTIKVKVSFTDDEDNAESVTSAATGAVAGPAVTAVPADWSLIPDGLGAGDQFRLLFLSSSSRNATPTSIATYNTWIQDRVDAGHTDIQDYTETFRAVGCTAAVDARDDTGTTYTSDDKGVPIYWLNGDKAADEYEDFYDETWDEEASMRDESGNTVSAPGSVWTGCEHDGTEAFANLMSLALGNNMGVIFGVPNSDATNAGPLSSGASGGRTVSRPLYGLSGVFSVSPPGEILYSATLTVGEETFLDTYLGYHSGSNRGSLHPVIFTYAGSFVGVFELSYSVGGDLVLDVTTPGASLLGSGSFNLYLDGAAFLIEDPASDSDGAFEFSNHGLSWTNGQIVRVWLTENREPKLTISGTTLVGQTLTATIDEPDGLPASDQITYQWIRVDGNTESDISGETGSTYTLVDADEGKTIKVEASYTDNANFAESLTSAATTAVVAGKAALVSNLGQAAHSAGVSATDSQDLAQGFTTGSRSGGYTLGSVELDVTGFTGTASDVTVSIYSESGNDPNTAVHVLTTPASISGLTTFTAPSNANLAADTQYYVVITTAGEDVTLSRTDSTADDSGGAAGWSIQDSGRINETGWTITTRPLRISIKGLATASDDATLSDLVLNDGTNDLTLTPTFASGMTSYTAEVAYTIDQLTLTPTKSDSNADVEYLDDDDKTIADADTVTTGQQVDLKEGANTIKVKVTAEDYVATETYEVTVTRETARAHCDDTEVWCETMVVGSVGAVMGWDEPGLVVGGALSADDEDFDYGMHTYDFTSIFLSGSTLSIQFNAGSTGDLESRRTRDKLVFTVDGQEFNLGAGELHSNGRSVTWNSTNLTWGDW